MKETLLLTPIGDRVLIKPSEVVPDSKIVIPDAHKENPRIFEVIRLGTKREDDKPFDVAIGERVLVGQYTGIDIKVDGAMCKIVSSSELLCVFKDK